MTTHIATFAGYNRAFPLSNNCHPMTAKPCGNPACVCAFTQGDQIDQAAFGAPHIRPVEPVHTSAHGIIAGYVHAALKGRGGIR